MTSQQVLDVTSDGTTEPPDHDVTETSLLKQTMTSSCSPPEVMTSPTPKQTVASPTGGWWRFMVVLGSFIVHLLLGGFNRTYGVIYLQLQHRYNSTAAVTAGVGGMSTAMRMSAGPLASAMSERIGGRMTVVIGGLLLGLSVSLTAFVPNTETAFITLGLLSGIGGALTYVPSIVTVTHYFTRGRSTALGVATSGSGVGVFILPLLMEALFDYYGYQGGMVLIGGILLNTMVAGCLYRPLNINKLQEEEGISRKTNDIVINGDLNEVDTEVQMHLTGEEEHVSPCDTTCKSTSRTTKTVQCPSPLRTLGQKLHLSLLCERPFLAYFFAQVFTSACYWPAQMLLPALATSHGHSTQSAMLILAILGGTDVVGRLAGGALFDVPWVKQRRRAGYAIVLLLTGLSVLAWPAVGENYPLLAIGVTVHGLVAGALVSLKGVMVGDLVGTRLLAGGLGLTVFAQGIGVMTAPPIAGFLRDVTATYTWSFIFLGSMGVISFVCFFAGAVQRPCQKPEGASKDPC